MFADYLNRKLLENTKRVQGRLMDQNLSFLFEEHGAKLTEISIQTALEIRIEFGNVALWYGKSRGEVDVTVAPLHARNAARDLVRVLHYLANERSEPKPLPACRISDYACGRMPRYSAMSLRSITLGIFARCWIATRIGIGVLCGISCRRLARSSRKYGPIVMETRVPSRLAFNGSTIFELRILRAQRRLQDPMLSQLRMNPAWCCSSSQ